MRNVFSFLVSLACIALFAIPGVSQTGVDCPNAFIWKYDDVNSYSVGVCQQMSGMCMPGLMQGKLIFFDKAVVSGCCPGQPIGSCCATQETPIGGSNIEYQVGPDKQFDKGAGVTLKTKTVKIVDGDNTKYYNLVHAKFMFGAAGQQQTEANKFNGLRLSAAPTSSETPDSFQYLNNPKRLEVTFGKNTQAFELLLGGTN